MAFAEGNELWKLRAKSGRNHIIQDPEWLLQKAYEYFEWCEENPIIKVDYRGKDSDRVELEYPRPFKKEQLARFCGVGIWKTINQLKDVSDDFLQVITHIEEMIANQKYDYAAVGMFNAVIVARDLGLRDGQSIDMKGDMNLNITPIQWFSNNTNDQDT